MSGGKLDFSAIRGQLDRFEKPYMDFMKKLSFKKSNVGSTQTGAEERRVWGSVSPPHVPDERDEKLEAEQRSVWKQFLELERSIEEGALDAAGRPYLWQRAQCAKTLKELRKLIHEGEMELRGDSAQEGAHALLSDLRNLLGEIEREVELAQIEERVKPRSDEASKDSGAAGIPQEAETPAGNIEKPSGTEAPSADVAPEAVEEFKGKLDQVASRVDGLERRESLSYDFKSFGEITLSEARLVVGWEHTEANRRKLARRLAACLVWKAPDRKKIGKNRANLYHAWKAAKVFHEEKIAAQWSRLALARCPEKVSQAKALDKDEKLTLKGFLERKLKDYVVDEDRFQGVRDERDLDRIRSNIIEFFTDRMLMAQDKLELTWSNLDRTWDLAEADALDLWRRQLRVLDASADEQPPGGTADPAAPDDEDSPHG